MAMDNRSQKTENIFQSMRERSAKNYQQAQVRMTDLKNKVTGQYTDNNPTNYSWTGKSSGQMTTLEKIGYLRKHADGDTARAAFAALSQEIQTVGSRHYSPYLANKSNQKEAMAFFGRNSFDQNWFDSNRYLLNYVNQLDMTDTVSTSGQKNWSQAQWAGYYYQMLSEAEQTTRQAESEWAQLRSDMQRNFREYERLYGEAPSYEKLMSYIDMADYSTLRQMDKVYNNVEDLVRLNRPVNYTPETVMGVYAALTKGKDVTGDRDYFEDAVQYTMQPHAREKKAWEVQKGTDYSKWTDEQIEAKRQEIRQTGTRADLTQFEADLYASVPRLGSVDSESYFNESWYDQAFLDKYAYLNEYAKQLVNRDGKIEKPSSSDPWWYHAAYEYAQIKEREEATVAAEREWTALREWLNEMYEEGTDPQEVLDYIDWEDYPTLEKIRKGQDVDMNRPVYFSDEAVLGALKAAGDGADVGNDDYDYAHYEAKEKPPVQPEAGTPEARQQEADTLWEDVTGGLSNDTLVEKAFYEEYGRRMTQDERVKHGLTPRSMEGWDPSDLKLGSFEPGGTVEKGSIFGKEYNNIAASYTNPKTGKAYENMDELIANDPALLSSILEYVEVKPEQTEFSTEEVEQLNLLRRYQRDLETGAVDHLFQVYADDNAVDADKLDAAMQYIIQAGLTLEEKDALGLLGRDESLDLIAERSRMLVEERGNEFSRAMATAILPKDAPEWLVNVADASLSNVFAVETGIAGGVLGAQNQFWSLTRDIWSAAMGLKYQNQLGEGYTLDQACEIDPILRGLTAAVDKAEAIEGIASPDMSNYRYGAQLTQAATELLTTSKMDKLYFTGETGLVTTAMDRMGLAGLGDLLQADKGVKRIFGKAINAAPGAVPYMLRSMSEGTQAARDEGASEQDALRYGAYSAATTGLIEGLVSQAYDAVLSGGGNLITKGLNKATKGGLDKFLKLRGVEIATNFLQQALGEAAEEAIEHPLDKLGRHLYLSQQWAFGGSDAQEMWDNAKAGFGVSLIASTLFGLTADVDTTVYTDSEKLAMRIARREVSVDEMVEYAMSITEGVEQDERAEQTESNPAIRDSVRIMEEGQQRVEEAAIQMAADAVVEEQIANGAMDDIIGEASVNQQALRQMDADIQATQQKADKLQAEHDRIQAQRRAALYDMISNGISPEKGAARQLMHNLEETASAVMRKHQVVAETLGKQQSDKQLKLQQIDAEIRERKNELNAAALEQKRKEWADAQAKTKDEIDAFKQEADSFVEDVIYHEVTQFEWAENDWGGQYKALANSADGKYVLLQDSESGLLKVAHLTPQGKVRRNVSALTQAIRDNLMSARPRRDPIAEHLFRQFKAEPVRFVTQMNWLLTQDSRKLTKADARMRMLAKVLKSEGYDLGAYEQDKISFADKTYATEDEAMADEQFAWSAEKIRKVAQRPHPESKLNEKQALGGGIDQILWGEGDVYAPFSAQVEKEVAENEGSVWDAYDEEERSEGRNSETGSEPSRDDYVEIPSKQYNEMEEQLHFLEGFGVSISGEHLRKRYETKAEHDAISDATDGRFSTVARSKDGRYILIVDGDPWEKYKAKLAEYQESVREYRNIGASEVVKKAFKKPESPRGMYYLLDTEKSRPFESASEHELDVIEVVDRIRERAAKLQSMSDEEIDHRNERLNALRQLVSYAKKNDDRRFMIRLVNTAKHGDENSHVIQEVRAALGDKYDEYIKRREMSQYDRYTKEQLEELERRDKAKYEQYIAYDKQRSKEAERGHKDASNRFHRMIVARLHNANQAFSLLEKHTGEPEHKKDPDWSPETYDDYRADPVYYATDALIEALDHLDEYYVDLVDGLKLDVESFVENNPGVFFKQKNRKNEWDQAAADARIFAPYESRLVADNNKYTVIDSDEQFNLVVAKKDTRLDAHQTGDVRVNPDIYSVTDAKRALQRTLDDTLRLMRQQSKVYAPEGMAKTKLSGKQQGYYAGNVVYSVRGADGELVSKTALQYAQEHVDPETGKRQWPTADDLLAIAERVTVSYTAYDFYYPEKVDYNNKKTGTTEKRERMTPYRDGGQDQYRFTLESTNLAGRIYNDIKHPNNADAHEGVPDYVKELRRAQQEYRAYVGKNVSFDNEVYYFMEVCAANYDVCIERIKKLNGRLESDNIVDEELGSLRQQIKKETDAATTWKYVDNLLVQALMQKDDDVARKIMRKYDDLLKKGSHATMEDRLKLVASMRKSAETIRLNQLNAAVADVTLQELNSRREELRRGLDEIMTARNQAAVSGYAMPTATHNEPLAQAVIDELTCTEEQIAVMEQDGVQQPIEDAQEPVEAAPEETPAEAPEAPENGGQEATEAPEPEMQQPEQQEAQPEVGSAEEAADRAYLEAIAQEPEVVEETSESAPPQDIDPEVPAEDLTYTAPVAEYMQRAGFSGQYEGEAIISGESHQRVEDQANEAYNAVGSLTARIDEMASALKSGLFEPEQAAAIRENMQTYIAERNRIKELSKKLNAAVAGSEYLGNDSVRLIVEHCMETGDVDWESPLVRSKQIESFRQKEMDGIRQRLKEKTKGGLNVLSIEDVAEIIGTEEMDRTLKHRQQVGRALFVQTKKLGEEMEIQEKRRDEINKQIEDNGRTPELAAELARVDEFLLTSQSRLERGQKAMRMFYDSGSNLDLTKILNGEEGGKLPLPVMNVVYAMLKQAQTDREDSTNRNGLLTGLNNPSRVIESFTGEFAPIFNAMYISGVYKGNAKMAVERKGIIDELKSSGIDAKNEEVAFRYLEGKITEEELRKMYPHEEELNAILDGAEKVGKIYENLFEEVNKALVRNGFDPIKHRKRYVHHMREAQNGIGKACSMLGIHLTDDTLPTATTGKTDELKPRRQFAAFSLARKGDKTSYTLRRNTMAYVDAALKVIHHTDNISRLRQLEGISEATQNKAAVYSGLRQYGELAGKDVEAVDTPKQAYSTFTEWVSRYADGLAGKRTSYLDRAVDSALGRNALQVVSGLKKYSGAAVTAYNLSIATSNILPVTMMGSIAPKQTLAALAETIDACKNGEMRDFEAKSDFLTARYAGGDMEYNRWDEFVNKGYVAAEAVDRFAAHTVVRAYYKLGLSKGWTDSAAMAWADEMARRMMASRNIGEGANMMNSTIEGAVLQFSREGINNLQFLIHDLPAIHGDDKKVIASLFALMIGNYLYNWIFGKETALEPVTPTIKSVRGWNDEKTFGENALNAFGYYADAANPTNIGTGGGYGDGVLESVPVVSAVSDVFSAGAEIVKAKPEDRMDAFGEMAMAILGFVPGSVAAERTLKGIGDLSRGYAVDGEGNIKYVLRTDEFSAGTIHDVLATLAFGSGNSLGGREYKRGGNKPMTKTQTEAFHSQQGIGKSSQEAFDAVNTYADQTGNRDARGMALPEWASKESETDWMRAALEVGPEAYPHATPNKIAGVELTDEEKAAFEKTYRTAYRLSVLTAMKKGGSIAKAAEEAYSKAYDRFKDEMEE